MKNPAWINPALFAYTKAEEISDALLAEINANLERLQYAEPLVSVVIPAWNEEVNIVRTLYYLAKSVCTFPVEIIVVNNNSTDRTQQMLDRLKVKSIEETRQGCGPARQRGQEVAQGKYILMADADCCYPKGWMAQMTTELLKANVVCVYGRYSFLGKSGLHRFSLFIYETFRDCVVELRHFKRPYLNALGMSMGYKKELGLKVGFVDRKVRGEDGRMCFDLMRFGKVSQVRGRAYRVWTLPRTLDKEGNLLKSLFTRILVEVSRIGEYFYKKAPHDTKSSKNTGPFFIRYFRTYKNVHKPDEVEADKDEHPA